MVIIYGCDACSNRGTVLRPPPRSRRRQLVLSCMRMRFSGVFVPNGFDVTSIACIIISNADGRMIVNAMQANASLNVRVSLIGPGTATAPSELAAVNALVNTLTFLVPRSLNEEGVAGQRWWDTQITDPSRDPCTDRLYGFWCENGHVVLINLEAMAFNSTRLPEEFGAFLGLRVLHLLSNSFTGTYHTLPSRAHQCAMSTARRRSFFLGDVPCTFGALRNLTQLDIRFNQLTSVPACSLQGSASTLVEVYFAGNALVSMPSIVMVTRPLPHPFTVDRLTFRKYACSPLFK